MTTSRAIESLRSQMVTHRWPMRRGCRRSLTLSFHLFPLAFFADGRLSAMKFIARLQRMAALARTPVFPEATHVEALSALLRRSLSARRPTALDPKLPFEVDPTNSRYEPESGLRPRRRLRELRPGRAGEP